MKENMEEKKQQRVNEQGTEPISMEILNKISGGSGLRDTKKEKTVKISDDVIGKV